jgi:ATP-binding cassette subfamily C protein CydC
MRRLLRLLALYRPFYGWMALGVLAALATVLANVTLMAVSGWFISSMAIAGAAQVSMNYFTPAAIIRGAAIVRTGGRYVERLVTHEATLRLLAVLRGWFYARLEPLAPAALQRYRSGDLVSRLGADIDTLDNVYLRLLVPVVVALLATLVMTLYLATLDPLFGWVLLAMLLAAGLVLPLLMAWLGDAPGRRRHASLTRQRVVLVDAVQGLGEAMVYGAVDARLREQAAHDRALVDAQAAVARVQGLSSAGILLLANLAMWLLLWLAIDAVEAGRLAPADIAMLALFALAAFEAVAPLPATFQAYGETRAAAQRLFAIVDTRPAVDDPPASPASLPAYDLCFERVAFRYPGDDRPVLDGVDFALPAGRRLTVVGPSGAGKSTLVDLLARFHDPDAGRILLGGEPLTAFRGDDLRALLAVVEQDARLFTGTLRDNLLLGDPQADEAALAQACRRAGLEPLLARLADGYDTWIGEAGATLSGGEARRVALARALLRDAPILVLDEPTEGLDATTAAKVLQAIDQAAQGRSVLLISHRPPAGALFGPVLRLPG